MSREKLGVTIWSATELPSHTGFTGQEGAWGAIEQRDAADEGRLEAYGSILVGPVIVNHLAVVRPSQLIASVGWTNSRDREGNDTPPSGKARLAEAQSEDARCSSWAFPTVQPPKPATHAKKRNSPGHRVVKAPS
jgi:hypothetical protein